MGFRRPLLQVMYQEIIQAHAPIILGFSPVQGARPTLASKPAIRNPFAAVEDKPMLISLSFRTGTVAEEAWDEVVRGRKVTVSRLKSSLAGGEVVRRARAAVGQHRYNLITRNCEHFVREMLGLSARSRQLETAAGAGVSTLLLALRFARIHPAVTVATTAFSLMLGSRWSAR